MEGKTKEARALLEVTGWMLGTSGETMHEENYSFVWGGNRMNARTGGGILAESGAGRARPPGAGRRQASPLTSLSVFSSETEACSSPRSHGCCENEARLHTKSAEWCPARGASDGEAGVPLRGGRGRDTCRRQAPGTGVRALTAAPRPQSMPELRPGLRKSVWAGEGRDCVGVGTL